MHRPPTPTEPGAAGRKPAILFISYTAEWTGPTRDLMPLLRHLKDRFRVAVVLPKQGSFSETLQRESIPVISLPSLDRRCIPVLIRLIGDGGYDLVYGNNTSGSSRNALIAARLSRVPFICHVRGMGQRRQWRKYWFLRLAHAVIAVSDACAKSVAPYAGRKRLHLVPSGVDLEDLERHASTGIEDARAHPTGVPPDAPIVLSLAHLRPLKGQHYAVEAMAQVVRHVPSAHLLLVGAERDRGYVRRIEDRIRQLGLQESISLLGFRRDIVPLLRTADVFLHTSTSEGQGLAVLEAMAAGLPVVAFGIDGVAESVQHENTGILCSLGDTASVARAIITLLLDESLRRKFGERGRMVVAERFASADSVVRTAHIIEDTLVCTGAAPRSLGSVDHGLATAGEVPRSADGVR
jgi:glycosyltransferase involved in cell wall biosynthesis